MRAYLLACLAIILLGAGGYFFLGTVQQPSGVAYTTAGARINPDWSWRTVFRRARAPATKSTMNIPAASAEMVEGCDLRAAYQWIFVDFGDPEGESALCSISQ